MIYILIRDALLEKMDFRFASETRPFLFVYIPTEQELDVMMTESDFAHLKINEEHQHPSHSQQNSDTVTYRNFSSICSEAVKNYAGIAICTEKGRDATPKMTIRFGALYSFLNYDDMGGPPQLVNNMIKAININPKDPKQTIINENDKSLQIGEPDDLFFPKLLRILIQQEFKKFFNDDKIEIDFVLREQGMFALRHMIWIKSSQDFINLDQQHKFMNYLTWYMPLYLPLVYSAPNDAIDVYH